MNKSYAYQQGEIAAEIDWFSNAVTDNPFVRGTRNYTDWKDGYSTRLSVLDSSEEKEV